jgi:hypothetical protein
MPRRSRKGDHGRRSVMATSWDDCIAQAEAALGKINALETAAMRRGDIVTMNALQGDSNDLTLKLTQLQALKIQATLAQIATLSRQLDAVSNSAGEALTDLSNVSAVLTGILTVTSTLDSLIAIAAKAAKA